ncbi:MAG: Sir2 family NAD-dependent protein deacetylase [Fimbriimonadaceae bacterium]
MKIAILTGAGVSRESGLQTFRDGDGLWEGHRVQDVATPEAWARDPAQVLRFYDARRADVQRAQPNAAHFALAELEREHAVTVITQNIDDLHERAGSTRVVHLHGEVLKARSVNDEGVLVEWSTDLALGDVGPDGEQLRPHVVWFGEGIIGTEEAWEAAEDADVFIVCGTSLLVQPAASLIDWTKAPEAYIVDPRPTRETRRHGPLTAIPLPATEGIPPLVAKLLARTG